jgi:hypothetical protein
MLLLLGFLLLYRGNSLDTENHTLQTRCQEENIEKKLAKVTVLLLFPGILSG